MDLGLAARRVLATGGVEIADAVLFLASDRAGYITGTTLSIDGGSNPVVLWRRSSTRPV